MLGDLDKMLGNWKNKSLENLEPKFGGNLPQLFKYNECYGHKGEGGSEENYISQVIDIRARTHIVYWNKQNIVIPGN